MNTSNLQVFVTKTEAHNRITFGDVRRLQRDILPDGIPSRAEVELLLGLDARVARADSAWTDWLVAAIVDYVVWVERPTGSVPEEASRWLNGLLLIEGRPTRAGRRIAREIRQEAERVAEPMESFATEDDEPVGACDQGRTAEADILLPAAA
jgi:hypothetical protein